MPLRMVAVTSPPASQAPLNSNIAAINIEAAYHGVAGGDYLPFEGICLTDTFQLYEQEKDLISDLMEDNSNRRTRQKALDIRVIVGNPPYSVGQKSENDNADNLTYPKLDGRIRETYAKQSNATLSKGLYDSYIRAIRWASDRIGDTGVIAYISNSGWLEAKTGDGIRKSLADEMTSIHVFNLRGNIRKNMLTQSRAKEGQNVFGSGSMTGIAIALFVKNPTAKNHGQIYYHDIGDDLSTQDKLLKIKKLGGISGISETNGWKVVSPDEHGDWLAQRDASFDAYLRLGEKDGLAAKLFHNFSFFTVTIYVACFIL